jgi:hypothetical protein
MSMNLNGEVREFGEAMADPVYGVVRFAQKMGPK